eukprot:CAMPEP_0180275114 /NCGR_PEP_ID=MMETSP0988-20121125/5674_1 /TAXON_ID=697907 /ORGANISM="non described non described, Strain CCMP2293" /LENGTH=79 /DNA_ID=CAMNT_0022246367 /DNA_START=354 /DNA_END=590 /DNA_ORIENTATION=+
MAAFSRGRGRLHSFSVQLHALIATPARTPSQGRSRQAWSCPPAVGGALSSRDSLEDGKASVGAPRPQGGGALAGAMPHG